MKIIRLSIVPVLSCFLFGTVAHAATITLPNYTNYAYQYGDFYSYAINLLKYENLLSPTDESAIKSSAGQLKNLPVIATGSSAANNTPQGMDNSYITSPSQGNVASTFSTDSQQGASLYQTTQGNKTISKDLTNYNANTWDINLTDLRAFLTDSTGKINGLAVLFDNNQSQGPSSPSLETYGQIAIWGQGVTPIVFDFVNVNNNNGQPGGLGAYQYTSNGEKFTTDKTTVSYVEVPNTTTGTNISSNVGNDTPDFVIVSPELNALLTDTTALAGYSTASFFVDFWNRTAGNEQIYLASADITENNVTTTPEPASMLLMGIGATGMAFMQRRKAKNEV